MGDESFNASKARFESLEARCSSLHASLMNEAGERANDSDRSNAQLAALSLRLEDEHATCGSLTRKVAVSSAGLEELQRNLSDIQRKAREDVQRQAEMCRTIEATAIHARRVADEATVRSDAAQRLAADTATEVRRARAEASGANAVAEEIRIDMTRARSLTTKASEVAARGEASAPPCSSPWSLGRKVRRSATSHGPTQFTCQHL